MYILSPLAWGTSKITGRLRRKKKKTMYFDELDLNDDVLDALEAMRFETCTPIQEKCIPEILSGRDVLGVAQTGTGKTAAYLLPVLSKLADGGYPQDAINCVIMSPTRELAQQIDQAMQGFSYYLNGVSSLAIYGGNDGNRYDQELKSLSAGADVIIATPGRLISHINMGNADFSKVSFFILDEADRMLDMGFSEDIMKIAKELPDTCQTIMFSATMPDKIEDLARTLLKNPVEVKVAVSKPAEKIRQSAYVCYENQKLGIIKDLFGRGDMKRVIVFSGKKQKVKLINRALLQMHINSGEMHSDLDQAERDQMLYKFKTGQIDVLVATDILSRGIDIDDIAMVINFDVPHDSEDYVHRIGRTARADRDGVAITFVSDEEAYYFKQIEKFLEKTIDKTPLPEGLGEAPDYDALANRRGGAKTSAKSRRRKDRDATSHKRKPRRSPDDQQRKPKTDKPATTETPSDAPVGQTASSSTSSEQTGDNAPKNNRRRNSRRRGRGQNGEGNAEGQENTQNREKRQPRQQKPRNEGEQRRQDNEHNPKGERNPKGEHQPKGDRQPKGGRQQGGNRGSKGDRQQGGDRQPRNRRQQGRKDGARQPNTSSSASSQRSATSAPQVESAKSGGLSSIIKKPLKWLKSLGKK